MSEHIARQLSKLAMDKEHLVGEVRRRTAEIIAAVYDCDTEAQFLTKTPQDFGQLDADVASLRIFQSRIIENNKMRRELARALDT